MRWEEQGAAQMDAVIGNMMDSGAYEDAVLRAIQYLDFATRLKDRGDAPWKVETVRSAIDLLMAEARDNPLGRYVVFDL